MKNEEIYERIYKKFDGNYGELVRFTTKLFKMYKDNIKSQGDDLQDQLFHLIEMLD